MKGILFDEIHSYDDLNLVTSQIKIPPASVKTSFIDIPGGDGSIDQTEALGEVKYKDRGCEFTFTVFPYEDFEEKKTYVSNLLNGRRCKIILDKDPEYYWYGRCSINAYATDRNLRQIVVGATVAPYKLKTRLTEVVIPAGNNTVRTLINGRKSVVPTIDVTADDTKITFNNATHTLNIGKHTIANLELKYGENPVTVSSNGVVTFTYQEGEL